MAVGAGGKRLEVVAVARITPIREADIDWRVMVLSVAVALPRSCSSNTRGGRRSCSMKIVTAMERSSVLSDLGRPWGTYAEAIGGQLLPFCVECGLSGIEEATITFG
jgi:hypothetical protein